MKIIAITFRQAIRLRMLLNGQQGKRKDSRVRICRDLKRRLAISDEGFMTYAREVGNGQVLLNLALIDAQPDLTLTVKSEEEVRVLTELIEGVEWSVADLDSWVEPLMDAIAKAEEADQAA